jgi:hypothetical protein
MSAGTGVRHSELNASDVEPVHFLQIWILPKSPGLPPSYEQKHFDPAELDGKLRVVASPDGRAGSVTIHQDVLVLAARLDAGARLGHTLPAGRKAYLHVARGALHANGVMLSEGDGAKIQAEPEIELASGKSAEVLLFELPG